MWYEGEDDGVWKKLAEASNKGQQKKKKNIRHGSVTRGKGERRKEKKKASVVYRASNVWVVI